MKLPKRFALSTLLLAMLLASLTFGILAWRADTLRQEVKSINRERVARVYLSESWLWPKVSPEANLIFTQDANGNFYIDDELSTSTAGSEKFKEMNERLKAIGVQEVTAVLAAPEGFHPPGTP